MANYNSIKDGDEVGDVDPFADTTEERITMLMFVSGDGGTQNVTATKQSQRKRANLPLIHFYIVTPLLLLLLLLSSSSSLLLL
jgi:hypothetical protein